MTPNDPNTDTTTNSNNDTALYVTSSSNNNPDSSGMQRHSTSSSSKMVIANDTTTITNNIIDDDNDGFDYSYNNDEDHDVEKDGIMKTAAAKSVTTTATTTNKPTAPIQYPNNHPFEKDGIMKLDSYDVTTNYVNCNNNIPSSLHLLQQQQQQEQQQQQRHKFCGCCCDMRCAVITMNCIMIGMKSFELLMYFLLITFWAYATKSSSLNDDENNNSNWYEYTMGDADDYYQNYVDDYNNNNNQQQQQNDGEYPYELQWDGIIQLFGLYIIIAVLQLLGAIIGCIGGIQYNTTYVTCAGIMYCWNAMYSFLFLIRNDDYSCFMVVLNLLFAYPHYYYIKEYQIGLLTPNNYYNPKQSCCCV